ncbi:MAG TPA: bifunctional 4-hydroxy-2-oxoglutarate aldolase/2-dehydro-3-deoxy-phosphogluconate aldolase [Candidatus Hydrogenedentes bacterium]|nr:bifunctional 4-hydroxy-2-oxoglutarate aldolase/2-dehydro-3-deoxy-phosphogluconate aldolase [Candidatus Hydrogenedentota bacterium]HOV74293.1 bifunctional 4-hydroxy-2-oxoglutarate aldolase/2-dehydro-3-deoxy-phosphogluconate aldolase [Candidatus Hydrogenedentota bacterium]HPC15014.1 bifunctional 4-hydroxy-2-oxoglutarate aldolase/2-dehydro-3-deoxy-phosphogluconate aldolase [Candidatus Hydrogenedentota bacterium]HRT19125.1 bifunctional 4-hydroxy-2-oxoglutarate aldolase/2-dehydro-3-deoxy-phosphogl
MEKHAAVQYILDQCIIAVVRADSGGDDLVRVVEAIAAGGVHCIEVTMTTPGALKCIEAAATKLAGADVLLGVGTVLDAETCRMAILAGAEYVVSPTLSAETIRMARRYGVPMIAGAYTPTEILAAWEQGADFVKVFPASIGGPDYIKAVKAPLPQIPLVPTGGVELENIGAFLKAGASALAVGGNLVTKKMLANRDFAGMTENAKKFAGAVLAARG